MPWFYVDDGFSDSRPVENLPDHMVKVPLRLAVCGLWLLAGSWSAKEETDGLVPASKMRALGGTPTVIRSLVELGPLRAPLCDPGPDSVPLDNPRRSQLVSSFRPNSDPIRFRNWPKWQKTHAELVARREVEAEKKRGQRLKGRNAVPSNNENLSPGDTPGDTPGDSPPDPPPPANPVPRGHLRDAHVRARRPDPTRPISDSPSQESSPYVDADVGAEIPHHNGPTIEPSASRLVSQIIPTTIPADVRTRLRIKASELIRGDHTNPEDVAEALRRWLNKPGAGTGLLSSLAADVIRERTATPTPHGRPKHKMRTLVEQATEQRAQEQAQLVTTSAQKELE